jgi:outer membrane murein-binding lipoprotein Lpp
MKSPARLLSALPLAALLALGAGCSSGHDATAKELAELRAEVTRLRAQQAALGERVEAIEIDRGSFGKNAAPAAAPASPGGDRPDLAVVRLSPSEGDGDADSDAPRPVIRAAGDGGSIQKGDARKAKDAKIGTPKKKATADSDARPTVKP